MNTDDPQPRFSSCPLDNALPVGNRHVWTLGIPNGYAFVLRRRVVEDVQSGCGRAWPSISVQQEETEQTSVPCGLRTRAASRK